MKDNNETAVVSAMLFEDPIRDLVKNLHLIFPHTRIMFFAISPSNNFSLVCSSELSQEELKSIDIPPKSSVISSVSKSLKPVVVELTPKTKKQSPILPSTKSVLAYPIPNIDSVNQLVYMESEQESYFEDNHLLIVEGLVSIYKELQETHSRISRLTHSVEDSKHLAVHSHALLNKIEAEEILQASLDHLCQTLGVFEGAASITLPELGPEVTISPLGQKEV